MDEVVQTFINGTIDARQLSNIMSNIIQTKHKGVQLPNR